MSKYKYLLISLGFILAMVAALLAYLNIGCYYSGTEFSPDDFSIRHFSYQHEPVTDWVIRGRTFKDTDEFDYRYYYEPIPDLVGEKFIKPVFKKKKTWHLLNDNGSYLRGFSSDSDARLLVDFLRLKDENRENKWTVWNSEHPKLAKVLWPLIAEMARDKIYLTVGDVLTFALNSKQTDPKLFKADLRQEVAEAYLKLGKIDFENNDLESADYRVEKSIQFHTNSEAKSLLNSIGSAKSTAEIPVPSSK